MYEPPARIIYINEGEPIETYTARLLEDLRQPTTEQAFARLDQQLVDDAILAHRDDLLEFAPRTKPNETDHG